MNNEEKILEILGNLTSNVSEIRNDIVTLKDDVSTFKDDITSIKSDISSIKDDVSELKHRVTKIEVTQENTVIPNIKLLAEGHTIIQNQIKHLSVVDALQDDVATLKNAVRYLSEEMEKIKKAM